MRISLIAAASTNRVIGLNNELPWHLPADMRFFKETTKGHHILMGRKTWESFPKPLPERTSLVVSSRTLDLPEGVFGFDSIEKAIRFAESRHEKELMVIGGGKIYEETLPLAHCLYLTRVYTKVLNGTTFFPPVKESEWKIVSLKSRPKDEKNAFDMDFMVLERE